MASMNQLYVYLYPLILEPPSNPHHHIPLGCHRASIWAPCATNYFPLAICFTNSSVYMSMLFSQFHPFLPLLCPQVHSLHLCLCPCPTNWFITIIFLDSYICIHIWYLFFSSWLSSLCVIGYVLIHLTTTDSNYFLLWVILWVICCIYHKIFIHSYVNGYLGFFHVLLIVNSVSVNTWVHVSFGIMVFSG